MLDTIGLERCMSFVNCQLRPTAWKLPDLKKPTTLRAVTISRQAGCGALIVAEKLAKRLKEQDSDSSSPWTVFDRNLIAKVLEEHHLPSHIAKFLTEDRRGELQDIIDDVIGLHPPTSTIIRQITETVMHLAERGNAILVGRGANVITSKLPGVFHVRLVASLERRVEHAHDCYNMDMREAREFVLREDRGRGRYLKKYFNVDIDDPLLYHLIINTSLVSYDEAARLIFEAALRGQFETMMHSHA